jgi:hypothetical protein
LERAAASWQCQQLSAELTEAVPKAWTGIESS